MKFHFGLNPETPVLYQAELKQTKTLFQNIPKHFRQTQILKLKIFTFLPHFTLQSPALTQNFISQLCLEKVFSSSSDLVAVTLTLCKDSKQHSPTPQPPSPSCVQLPAVHNTRAAETPKAAGNPKPRAIFVVAATAGLHTDGSCLVKLSLRSGKPREALLSHWGREMWYNQDQVANLQSY